MAVTKRASREVAKAVPSAVPSTFEEMERWFEDSFRSPVPWLRSWPRFRLAELEKSGPSVDIFDDGNNVIVKAELPGMSKKDIEVTLTDDMMTISGEKKKEEKVEKKNYYRVERSSGSFARSFRLPSSLATDKSKATFRDGVLEITLPKTAETKKRTRKVKVQ